MENIYVSVEPFKPLPKPPAPVKIPEASENSKKSFYLGVIIFLVLLNVLQAGRIVFGIYAYQSSNLAADLSAKLSSVTVERDQLNANLTDMAEELTRLRQMQACPAQWTTFGDSCYFLSGCGSWDEGREDCKKKNAHLVVINNAEEQAFVTNYTENSFWIGLNDKEVEGSWKWVDGTSPSVTFWVINQPDNGGKEYGAMEEDCAHIRTDDVWNDLQCSARQQWMCEKVSTSTV